MRRGFSLAEMMVAMLILSAVSVALVGVLPAGLGGTRAAGDRAYAVVLAGQTFESLRAAGPAALQDEDLPAVTNRGVSYQIHVTTGSVTASDGTPLDPGSARRVEVRVTWKDRANLVGQYLESGIVLEQ